MPSSASYARTVTSTVRPNPKTSPKVRVPIHHDGSSSNLATIPDAGVVMTIIGAQHLSSLGLSKEDLTLPINTIYYKADGSNIPPATGSF